MSVIVIHCILHQEALYVCVFGGVQMKNISDMIVKTVKFIQVRNLNDTVYLFSIYFG